jgi:glutamate carboxypeptidase
MVDALRILVEAESPRAYPGACAACADIAGELAARLLGTRAERCEVDGRVHLRRRFGSAGRVLLIGHLDTVWPLGTLASWPSAADGETASGPGTFSSTSAALGVPTLDGIGAVGDYAHGRGEYDRIGAMAERAALVADLLVGGTQAATSD